MSLSLWSAPSQRLGCDMWEGGRQARKQAKQKADEIGHTATGEMTNSCPLWFPGGFAAAVCLRPEPPTRADLTPAVVHACPSRNIRAAILPCSESTTCLFRTRPLDAADTLVFNEVFWVSMSYPALHQKTLRVDVCTTDRCHMEECLVRALSVCPAFCP